MQNEEIFGIIASIAWNSNRWTDEPTPDDMRTIQYANPKEYGETADYLNFGLHKLGVQKEDWFVGYTSILRDRLPAPEKRNSIKVLFLISTNHGGDGRRYVVGIYGFPEFAHWFSMDPKHKHRLGNIRSRAGDIVLLNHYYPINDAIAGAFNLLPPGKKISNRGWNDLYQEHVENLLRQILAVNPTQQELIRLIRKLKLSNLIVETPEPELPETLNEIKNIEEEIVDTRAPEKKERLSSYIERGTNGQKIKKINGYKCQVCEALGLNPIGFKKAEDGIPYIETHHVIPVSRLEIGTLGFANLVTVCANHHRQFHYGQVHLLENTTEYFRFDFDGHKIRINKYQF